MISLGSNRGSCSCPRRHTAGAALLLVSGYIPRVCTLRLDGCRSLSRYLTPAVVAQAPALGPGLAGMNFHVQTLCDTPKASCTARLA